MLLLTALTLSNHSACHSVSFVAVLWQPGTINDRAFRTDHHDLQVYYFKSGETSQGTKQ